jgi:Zn-finger nucleic acid-binding protein
MKCPRCGELLVERMHGLFDDIPVHECAACGGAFHPAGSLDRRDDSVTVNAERLEYEVLPSRTPLACPQCASTGPYRSSASTLLERLSHGGASLEAARCPRCRGFWLKRGALARVRQRVLVVSENENRDVNAPAKNAEKPKR